jgi:FKBP-type peptidyl-prolyl cis-trans isomerase FkpA
MSPKVQRIGIFVIAVVMLIGTLGSFALMVLANNNAQTDYEKQAEAQQKALEDQQKQADQLSAKYYPVFKQYQSSPASFDAASVGDSVTRTDLKEGTGVAVTKDSSYKAYYIGWNPKGNVFDSSFDGNKLKAPLSVSPGMLIAGWYDGVDGMKVGGVREITIPSDLAYKDQDMGANLPPNTPIKFIIMIVEES